DEVGGAAGRERHDHAQRPVGIALCGNPGGEEDENTEENPLHVSSDSMGSEIARLSRADLSKALVSISRLCASAAVACWVGRPSETRFSHCSVSSRIGPRSSPSAMSPGG